MKSNNEVWHYNRGYICGYTEDKALMYRINRYKLKNGWHVMATYVKDNKHVATQYRIPIEQRRTALRYFDVTDLTDK